jgi:hypothetical protein
MNEQDCVKIWNDAIEQAAKLVMFSTNDGWLVDKVRGLKLSEQHNQRGQDVASDPKSPIR